MARPWPPSRRCGAGAAGPANKRMKLTSAWTLDGCSQPNVFDRQKGVNMEPEHVLANLSYEWAPFTFDGFHLTFPQHCGTRLDSARCSHWGPAVYKWEGVVSSGPNTGKIGVLIGETEDLRHRIKQYVSGTQKRGNRLWREGLLKRGGNPLWGLW